MRSEIFSPPSTQAETETALMSPVSFERFLSNWKYGTQAAPTPTYHASNSNSRSASPYPSQGQDASGRSGQQHTEENSYTEMDSRRDCERDSAVQMVSDGVTLPAHHGADCDSDSQRQHTRVNMLLYCCRVVFVYLLSIYSTLSISLDPHVPVYLPLSACLFVCQPVCVVGRTYH